MESHKIEREYSSYVLGEIMNCDKKIIKALHNNEKYMNTREVADATGIEIQRCRRMLISLEKFDIVAKTIKKKPQWALISV